MHPVPGVYPTDKTLKPKIPRPSKFYAHVRLRVRNAEAGTESQRQGDGWMQAEMQGLGRQAS